LTPAARATLARYEAEPPKTRLHTRIRWRSCPFEAVAAAVPDEGRILEIGCGHGLFATYLALQAPRRSVVGTDVDAAKIETAQRASRGLDNLAFAVDDDPDHALPPGPWDAICIVDVLYLIDRAGERALLRNAADALEPGGILVVKEMATTPRWKFRWMALQERLSVQVLKITAGHDLTFVPPEELASYLTDAGLTDVRHTALDGGHLHPHHLLVARKPAAPG
jgi:2-polyprenyl-3-methyl-5-hydroxy-6-metoxy-1,4-benzoquinol methylase